MGQSSRQKSALCLPVGLSSPRTDCKITAVVQSPESIWMPIDQLTECAVY
jgi:hypothetical protein